MQLSVAKKFFPKYSDFTFGCQIKMAEYENGGTMNDHRAIIEELRMIRDLVLRSFHGFCAATFKAAASTVCLNLT